MTAFPSGVYDPRTKANKNGVVYDAGKETIGFAEDVTKLDDEVVAIETELGANPKGAKADVVARLDDVDTAIGTKQDSLTFGIADGNAVDIDDADAESGDMAKLTANGIEGRSAAEVRSDLNILSQKAAVKTSDETVNNSTGLQDDDELLLALGANETWMFELTIFFESATAADIKFTLLGPSGSSALWSFVDEPENLTRTQGQVKTRNGAGVGVKRACHIKGICWTSTTPGNVVLDWAQNTADVSDTKVLIGSNIIATRLA